MKSVTSWTAAFGGLVLLAVSPDASAQGAGAPKSERSSRVVAMAPGSIHGVVQDESGAPVGGAIVSAVVANGAVNAAANGMPPRATKAFVVSDRSGHYDLPALWPGAYVLTARCRGFSIPAGQTIDVRASSRTASFISLRRVTSTSVSAGADAPILAASVGLSVASARGETQAPGETQERAGKDTGSGPIQNAGKAAGDVAASGSGAAPADDPPNNDDHSELAWRLRHLRRSVLQDMTGPALVADDPSAAHPSDFNAPPAGLTRTGGTHAASLLAGASISGELNFLTTSSFDSPQQLFNGEMFARNVAYVSVGAPAGSNADWAVRGALSQADLSAWVIAGTYSTRGPARHQYDVGMSYATQRYDGGNPAALRDVTDGSRNAGAMYGFDTWTVSPELSVNYGARYARYDYLASQGLVSPSVGLTFSPSDRFRVTTMASRRAVAPGAEEFLPPGDTGIWLPPQRTFSALNNTALTAERTTHLDVGVERDLGLGSSVSLHAFRQYVADQVVTMFGLDLPGPPTNLGHYFVGNDGDVDARGLTAGFRTSTRRVQGTVEYSLTQARWKGGDDLALWVLQLPSEMSLRSERIHDLSTTIRTDVPETATKVVVLYRVSNAFAPRNAQDDGLDSRFDIQIRQSLPFLDFATAKWEMLVGIRNFFHETAAGQSVFDELLVVRPPKRIVGGLTMRF